MTAYWMNNPEVGNSLSDKAKSKGEDGHLQPPIFSLIPSIRYFYKLSKEY